MRFTRIPLRRFSFQDKNRRSSLSESSNGLIPEYLALYSHVLHSRRNHSFFAETRQIQIADHEAYHIFPFNTSQKVVNKPATFGIEIFHNSSPHSIRHLLDGKFQNVKYRKISKILKNVKKYRKCQMSKMSKISKKIKKYLKLSNVEKC